MSHTYEGFRGTTFIYNSDGSGNVSITVGNAWGVEVPCSDVLGFVNRLQVQNLDEDRVEAVARQLRINHECLVQQLPKSEFPDWEKLARHLQKRWIALAEEAILVVERTK